jgi:hypothetical protein
MREGEEVTAAPHLRVVRDEDPSGYIDVATPIVRRFLGMSNDEWTELAFFGRGKRIHVAHAMTAESHARLLHEGSRIRNFEAAYMLVNGPIDPRLLSRYPHDEVVWADNERAKDHEIQRRRAVFIDVDVDRPKGISATDAEFATARIVADGVHSFLVDVLGGDAAIGRGCSGNGFFLLVAIEPIAVPPKGERDEAAERISGFLGLLARKFNRPGIKIDPAVFNVARLMPAPGTMKRKGTDTTERPHRRTSFICRMNPTRVPLEALC